ncbi:MAG: hypothetical protein RSA20_11130, partial [Oscillospiraceae bacterium]
KYQAKTIADGKTVGDHPITLTGSATGTNYAITKSDGILTVLAKKLTNATETMPANPTDETAAIPPASVPDGTTLSNLSLVVSYVVTNEDKTALDTATDARDGFDKKINLEISLINTASGAPVQPKGEMTIFIPYPAGTNKNDNFALIHLLSSGTTQEVIPTKLENGLLFKVTSLSPFALGWKKGTPPTVGGGTGGETTEETYYYIQATAGVGGYINTPERVRVKQGESAGFTIVPNKGYQIADVKVNGRSIGAKKYYV